MKTSTTPDSDRSFESDILNKYPKIFRDKDKSMQETCMCWGLEVPKPWLPVIDELCEAMSNSKYTVYSPEYDEEIKFPEIVADQVKSKFRTLRFYYHLEYEQENIPPHITREHYKFVDGMIAYAETRIKHIEQIKIEPITKVTDESA
jgi:hypothetical protein